MHLSLYGWLTLPAVPFHKDLGFGTWQCRFPVTQFPSKVTHFPAGPSTVPSFPYLYRNMCPDTSINRALLAAPSFHEV